LLEEVVGEAEEHELLPRLSGVTQTLQEQLLTLPKDKPGRTTALRYVSALREILGGAEPPPAEVAPEVLKERRLIGAHVGVVTSSVTGRKEDYSQYQPRGRYTKNEALGRYFVASLYAARAGFALRDSAATGVTPAMADEQTQAALLIARTIAGNEGLREEYGRLDRLLAIVAGNSDDISPGELLEFSGETAEQGNGGVAAVRRRIVDSARSAGRLPRIVGGIVDSGKLEKGVSVAEATISFRLLGQRFSPDSAAIQTLVYDRVTDYRGKGVPFTMTTIAGRSVRGFPTVFDLMASLGSVRSAQILAKTNDSNYTNYDHGIGEAGRLMRQAARNPKSLDEMNLRLAYRLAVLPGGEVLNAAIGAWTQNRHVMLLYAKQSYTPTSKAIRVEPPASERTDARLETAPELYGDMIENLYTLETVLERPVLRQRVERFIALLRTVREIGYRQDGGERSGRDVTELNDIDITLKSIIGRQDRPLAVDIHTEPNSGQVVEEGIGFPRVVNHERLRGGRFDCYEFKQPMDKRLTDEMWEKLLGEGMLPRSTTALTGGF
jgi:hypothetical protein